jgi:hypothetical protein
LPSEIIYIVRSRRRERIYECLERAFDVTVIEPVLYFRYVNVVGEELDPLDKYNIPGEEALPSRFPSRSTG